MRLLQFFDFRSSTYERPNQNWVCGNLASGKPCRIGPGVNGRCRASVECAPMKAGGRWTCTRPPSAGGQCENGPLPDGTCCLTIPKCVPTRSLRSKRGRVVIGTMILTVGFLMLSLFGTARDKILSPGPVTMSHGEVGGCVNCHQGLDHGVDQWVGTALTSGQDMGDAKQCLSCHEFGENSFSAHNLAPDALAEASQRLSLSQTTAPEPLKIKLAGLLFDSPQKVGSKLACATCHKEHKGVYQDLKAMSNGRCQSCHSAQFTSFSNGHPSFEDYPYKQRTRIVFDHGAHFNRHFDKAGLEKAPTVCTSCHIPDVNGRSILLRGFDETCSGCHLEQIEGISRIGGKGIAFLGVPGFDVASLRDQGVEVGEWPELAEEPMTPFLEVLLSQDPALAADLARISTLDHLDLSNADAGDLAAVGRIVWGVKILFHELLVQGPAAIAAKLSKGFDQNLSKQSLSQLVASLPLDVIRSAQESWFPDLFTEVAIHNLGGLLSLREQTSEVDAVAAEAGQDTAPGTSDGDDSILGDDLILGDDSILGDNTILDDDDEIFSNGENILTEDEKPLSGDAETLPEDLGGENSESLWIAAKLLADEQSKIDQETWARLGGWYREEYSLVYRPVGHADAFLRAWIDLGAQSEGGTAAAGRAIFDQLAHKDAPGKCVKCHSVETVPNGGLQMMWTAARSDPEFKKATVFAHTAHFSMMDEDGCLTCHKVEPKADYAASYADTNPHSFTSNFAPLGIKTCAACHQENLAGDNCQQCHQYHVGRFVAQSVATDWSEDTSTGVPQELNE